jgi:hypothetical protein
LGTTNNEIVGLKARGKQQVPADEFHIDKLAYARAMFDGAGRIAATARDEPIGSIGIPFYLLIGFGIENALKALLEYKRFPSGKWQRSHDLSDLLSKAHDVGPRLPHGIPEFIENQSLFHQEFWFRYPERAGVADVYSATTAIYATEMLLRAVFDLTDASTKL